MKKINTDMIITEGYPDHGSPQDRGSADRYYGQDYNPHYWPNGTGHGTKIPLAHMTTKEIVAYTYGFENEQDRKNWG